jgi:hypothetical protein
MVKTLNTPDNFLRNRQSEDKRRLTQFQVVYLSLFNQPKTMLMVEKETGIMRSNICRYIATLRKRDCIGIVKKGICPISKYSAVQYLTTNPQLFQKSNQLNLF